MKQNNVGKNKINNVLDFMEKPFFKNLPKQKEVYPIITLENPVHKTNKTIEELKEIVEQQIVNAEKQEKNNKLLTKLTIFIAIISLLIQFVSMFSPNEEELTLSKKVLKISKDNFLNQAKILKLENKILKTENTTEKEKKLP